MGPLVGGRVEPLGALGQGLLVPSGITVVGQLKQGLVSIAPCGPYSAGVFALTRFGTYKIASLPQTK